MNSSESIKELATALAKAQAKMKTADKGSVNPHFKSKYADLAEVWEACRGALTSEGLSVIQGIRTTASGFLLDTTILHSSGEWMSSETPLFLPAPANMQHLGSAVTYAKRISLMAIAGISVGEADDDGEQNRSDIQKADDRRKEPNPEVVQFTTHIRELRDFVKARGLEDDVMNFGRVRSQEDGTTGIATLKLWVLNKDVFEGEYKEYLSKRGK